MAKPLESEPFSASSIFFEALIGMNSGQGFVITEKLFLLCFVSLIQEAIY